MYCKYCGQQVPDDSTFCEKCGKDLSEENRHNKGKERDKEQRKVKTDYVSPETKSKLPLILAIVIPVFLIIVIIPSILLSRSCNMGSTNYDTTEIEEEEAEYVAEEKMEAVEEVEEEAVEEVAEEILQDENDYERFADSVAENILVSMNKEDYEGFSRDFDSNLKSMLPEKTFPEYIENIFWELDDYIKDSKQLLELNIEDNQIKVIYKVYFENGEYRIFDIFFKEVNNEILVYEIWWSKEY